MENEGYIKLYRKMLNNPIICKDSDYFSVWVYLLLNATHSEYDAIFKNERIKLKSGQLITGRKVIAKKFNIDENKVQRILKNLEKQQQIEQQTSTKNRLISIVNWSEYQTERQPDKQQMNNERTTSEQPVNTNKNVKNDKNVKNERSIKKEKSIKEKSKSFDDVFKENCFSLELENTLKDFIIMRKTISKPMTTKALELLIKNLDKLTGSEQEKIEILNQSIERCWQTVYPLKTTINKNKGSINDFQELMEEAINEQNGNNTSNNTFSW